MGQGNLPLPLFCPLASFCYFSRTEPLETPQTCLLHHLHASAAFSLAWKDVVCFYLSINYQRIFHDSVPTTLKRIHHTNLIPCFHLLLPVSTCLLLCSQRGPNTGTETLAPSPTSTARAFSGSPAPGCALGTTLASSARDSAFSGLPAPARPRQPGIIGACLPRAPGSRRCALGRPGIIGACLLGAPAPGCALGRPGITCCHVFVSRFTSKLYEWLELPVPFFILKIVTGCLPPASDFLLIKDPL